ncbi:hypothetical protein FRC18_001050 [Serendipita sp. 400]|nr:hypothetical protein FRC18_001050 [Serendipita sp. 400]
MTDWKTSFDDGVANFKRKNYKEAIELFTTAINAQSPGHMALESRAAAYEQIDELKEALSDCRTLIKLFPDRHNGYTRASKILVRMKEYSRAVNIAKTGLSRIEEPKGRARLETVLESALAAQTNDEPHQELSECYISKLPHELLALIFEELVETGQMSPVRMCHVCRQWRQVMISMTKMWSRLVLYPDWKKNKAKTSTWMERSRGRLAELQVKSLNSLNLWLDQYGKDSTRHIERISFDIDGDNLPIHFLLDANPVSLYWRAKYSNSSHMRLPFRVQNKAPLRLTELVLIAIPIDWNTVAKQLKNLTKLVIQGEGIGCAHLFGILERSTTLVTLRVHVTDADNFDQDGRICLQNLVELKLTKGGAIIKHLELPTLEILELTRMDVDQALQDLSPQEPSLKLLNISRCINFSETRQLLPPSLTSLSLTGLAAKPDGWIEAIVKGRCPLLVHLDVSATRIGTGCLLRLIATRNGQTVQEEASPTPIPTSLESLVMNECQEIGSEYLSHIRAKVPLVTCIYERKNRR